MDNDSSSAGIQQYKFTLPAALTAATITLVFEPTVWQAIVRPDINGGGALTCAKYQTQSDTDEVGQAISLTNSQDNLMVGVTLPNVGRAILTYATGDTLSYVWIREMYTSYTMLGRGFAG